MTAILPALLGPLRGTVLELGTGGCLLAPAPPRPLDTSALAAGSVDAVVAPHLLCTVEDPGGALEELRRVLRPGGRYVFVEHLAPPAWRRLLGGPCTPVREGLVERAGFEVLTRHRFTVRGPWGLALPHVAGVARNRRSS